MNIYVFKCRRSIILLFSLDPSAGIERGTLSLVGKSAPQATAPPPYHTAVNLIPNVLYIKQNKKIQLKEFPFLFVGQAAPRGAPKSRARAQRETTAHIRTHTHTHSHTYTHGHADMCVLRARYTSPTRTNTACTFHQSAFISFGQSAPLDPFAET